MDQPEYMTYLKLHVGRDGTIHSEGLTEYSFGHRISGAVTWRPSMESIVRGSGTEHVSRQRQTVTVLHRSIMQALEWDRDSPHYPNTYMYWGLHGIRLRCSRSIFENHEFLETRLFKTIRAMPPNGKLTWEHGKLELSGGVAFTAPQHLS